VLVVSGSGCYSNRPRGAQEPAVLLVLREFLSRFVSIRVSGRFWLEVVGRTVRTVRLDYP
jgi:hypothetical protein